MDNTKRIICCGDYQLGITRDSTVVIYQSTYFDYVEFERKTWPIPEEPKYNFGFWDTFCHLWEDGACRGLQRPLWEAFCNQKRLSKEDGSKKLEIHLKHLNQYEHSIQMSISYYAFLTSKTELCTLHYPSDFALLLNTVFSNIKPRGHHFYLDQFLFKHREYTNGFRAYTDACNAKLSSARYQAFSKYANRHSVRVLCIDGVQFYEGACGFDLDNKYAEVQSIISNLRKEVAEKEEKIRGSAEEYEEKVKTEAEEHERKLRNSSNPGEKAVDYAIKWLLASEAKHVIRIANNCESKHRYNCIILCKPDFIDEPQEYDHILVCSAGVVIIETKHWKGKVIIHPDGRWSRIRNDSESILYVDNPRAQMKRHEVLMRKILPNVPIFSILCFSNASTIVDGRENFTAYPIVNIDQLENSLSGIFSITKYSDTEIDQIVSTIEEFKVNTK